MHRVLAITLLVVIMWAAPQALAADNGCDSSGDLNSQSVKCVKSGSETSGYIAGHSGFSSSPRVRYHRSGAFPQMTKVTVAGA